MLQSVGQGVAATTLAQGPRRPRDLTLSLSPWGRTKNKQNGYANRHGTPYTFLQQQPMFMGTRIMYPHLLVSTGSFFSHLESTLGGFNREKDGGWRFSDAERRTHARTPEINRLWGHLT